MSDDTDYDPDFLDDTIEVPSPCASLQKETALVIEDDPELAHVCVQRLARLGIRAEVVWMHDEAVAALSREGGELEFVYADARLLGGTCAAVAAQIRSLRPSTPFVVGTCSIDDVLLGDEVAILRRFDGNQFQAAYDASLCEDEARRVMHEAAEAARWLDEMESPLPAVAPEPELQLTA